MYVKPNYSKTTNQLISYSFICCGKNPITNKPKNYRYTWKVPRTLSSKKDIERAMQKAMLEWQDEVDLKSKGLFTKQENEYRLLSEYARDWVEDILVRKPQAYTYYVRQKDNIKVILDFFGENTIISRIDPIDCKRFYTYLSTRTYTKEIVRVKQSIQPLIDEKQIPLHKIADEMNLCRQTIHLATKLNEPINIKTAKTIAKYFHIPFDKYFRMELVECKYAKSVNLSIKTTLVMLLNEAINDEIIQVNYAVRAYKNQFENEQKEVDTYNLNEARIFIENASKEKDLRKKSIFYLFMYLGLRKAEVCGLEWSDFDFENDEISINRNSIYVNKDFGIITKTPKTKTSRRTNAIPTDLKSVLLEYKAYWEEEKEKHGDLWAYTDRLFLQDNGKPLSPSTVAQWIGEFEESIGLKHISPKGMRHTSISLLLNEAKIPIKVVSQRVGHADVKITMNTYAHSNADLDRIASEKFNELLCQNIEKTN